MILSDGEVRAMSALALAHMGDAVYEILARREVCRSGKLTAGELHRQTIRYVSAPAQARAAERSAHILRARRRPYTAAGATRTAMPRPAPRRRPSTTLPPGWRHCSGGSISADKTSGSKNSLLSFWRKTMPLDAILLTALRRELENSLLGAKIDRISMPEKDVLILSVHSREQGSRRVLISVRPGSARISLTEQTMENPSQPPMFCMLLRKYLIGARITALEQPLGERLLILRLDTVDELNCRGEKTLVLELMGKGLNLLLLDGDGHILDCIRRVDYEDPNRRALLPGLFYTLPPQQEKPSFFRTEREECERLLTHADRTQPPDKWLLDTFGGLSPLLCRELSLGGWEGLGAALDALRSAYRYRGLHTGDDLH